MTILCTDPATATVTLNIWPFYVLIRQRQRHTKNMTISCTDPATGNGHTKNMNHFMYWSGNGHNKNMTILCTDPATGNGHNKIYDHFMYWPGNGNGHTKYMNILCTDPATVTIKIWPFYVLIQQWQRSH